MVVETRFASSSGNGPSEITQAVKATTRTRPAAAVTIAAFLIHSIRLMLLDRNLQRRGQ